MRTGIRRKVDDLGRVVIPAGIRRTLGIREGDAVEVHVEGDRVVLAKPTDQCVFCRSEDALHAYHGKSVCTACVGAVGRLDDGPRRAGSEHDPADRDEDVAPWPPDRAPGPAPVDRDPTPLTPRRAVGDAQDAPRSTTAW